MKKHSKHFSVGRILKYFRNFLPLILIYIMNEACAQPAVIIANQPQMRDVVINGDADPWGGYVVGGHTDSSPSLAMLLRIRANGDTLFRRFPLWPESRIDGLISADDGTFLAYGDLAIDTVPPMQQYRHHIWILHIDTGLNILHENKYAIPAPYVGNLFMNGIRETDGNYVFCSIALGDYSDTEHLCDYIMMRLQPNGDSLMVRYINTGYNDVNVTLAASPEGDSLLLFGNIGQTVGTTLGVHYLDHDFHYLGNQPQYYEGCVMPFTMKRWNSHRLLTSGLNCTDFQNASFMPGICELSNDGSVISNVVCQPVSLFCREVAWRGMDFKTGNRIFAGGNKDLHTPWDYFSPTSYYICMMDTSLQQLNYWVFGGDMRYQLNSVIASPAGGCLLAGMRAPDGTLGLTNAYLVMLDAAMVMGTPQVAEPEAGIMIGPNPGSDEIHIYPRNHVSYDIAIYDLLGNLMVNKTNNKDDISLSTEALPAGLYACRLQFRDGRVITEKWMKR